MLTNNVARKTLLNAEARKIVLSGPSGFVGQRVLDSVLMVHDLRCKNKLLPGEIVLPSSSPGKLMDKLSRKYGPEKLRSVRASRVDFYTQHDIETWIDHLGSLGLEGKSSTFINLAAVVNLEKKKNGNFDNDSLGAVNYSAPLAAAKACQQLGFGHWIQASTQATRCERAGQVPYSRGGPHLFLCFLLQY